MITNKKKFDELITPAILDDYLTSKRVEEYVIRCTSGTTGKAPIMIVLCQKIPGFHTNSVGNFRRPVCFYGSQSARLNRLNQLLLHVDGSRVNGVLFLDYSDIDSGLNNLLQDFQPDCFIGFPSFMVRALKWITDKNILLNIKRLGLTGEMLTGTTEKILKEQLPNAILDVRYGLAELGLISQYKYCPFLKRNYYHPHKAVNIEIIDIDSHGVGELAVTKRLSRSVVVKRYATGDLGRFLSTTCRCGNPATFKLLGRANVDFIKIGGAMLHQEEFERVVHELEAYIEDYKVVAREVSLEGKMVDELIMYVVPAHHGEKQSIDFLEQEISNRLFLTPTQTLSSLVKKGEFVPFKIKCVTSFPRQQKNIKLQRIMH